MVLVPKPKTEPKLHHKKRYGQHRKHNAPYSRPYAPYLPLVAIVAVGFLINVVWSHRPGNFSPKTTSSAAVSELLGASNDSRTQNHEQTLRLNGDLAKAAQAKADDMATHNYWSHTSPLGIQPWTFIQKSGYDYQGAGENLAYGFASGKDVVKGWMNSQEHRDNLLNISYKDVGFGIAHAANFQGKKDQTIVVAMYGDPATGFDSKATSLSASARQITRADLFASAPSSVGIMSVVLISAAAAAWFIARHLRFVHRAFAYSEAYIVRHRKLDLVLVAVAIAGIILTRTAGFIH